MGRWYHGLQGPEAYGEEEEGSRDGYQGVSEDCIIGGFFFTGTEVQWQNHGVWKYQNQDYYMSTWSYILPSPY
jgi:hypothetical protein